MPYGEQFTSRDPYIFHKLPLVSSYHTIINSGAFDGTDSKVTKCYHVHLIEKTEINITYINNFNYPYLY